MSDTTPGTSPQPGLTVLVVDDSPTQLLRLEHVLDDAGFIVLTARSGVEGLEAARTHYPDLVVTDVVICPDSTDTVFAGLCGPTRAGSETSR